MHTLQNSRRTPAVIRLLSVLCVSATLAQGDVLVSVDSFNGAAWISYSCTSGEVVRAFPLDVTVDQGEILGVSHFFVGESTAENRGYGLFPASFRDHLAVNPTTGSVVTWNDPAYTPVAMTNDAPSETLPGLNSSGVTLEFGGLWDPGNPGAVPAATGLLCALQVSTAATVSVSANAGRGGIVAATSVPIINPVFSGAFVDPSTRTGLVLQASADASVVTVVFDGGELQITTNLVDWTGTGKRNGIYVEPLGGADRRFYRAHP